MLPINNKKECPKCAGKSEVICPRCQGSGKISTKYYNLTTIGDEETVEICVVCDGRGLIECPECGKGH